MYDLENLQKYDNIYKNLMLYSKKEAMSNYKLA